MSRANRNLPFFFALIGLVAFAGISVAKQPEGKHHDQGKHQGQGAHHHNNGKDLVGAKIKTNGHHMIDTKGNVTASVEVRDGKIAGLQAKHATKGDLPVKKYKSSKQMVQVDPILGEGAPRMMTVQDQYLGTVYIGYSYYDDYGNEEIYWFPYDMILDGDTGAIEYVETV